jgi:hypothetical protein
MVRAFTRLPSLSNDNLMLSRIQHSKGSFMAAPVI